MTAKQWRSIATAGDGLPQNVSGGLYACISGGGSGSGSGGRTGGIVAARGCHGGTRLFVAGVE